MFKAPSIGGIDRQHQHQSKQQQRGGGAIANRNGSCGLAWRACMRCSKALTAIHHVDNSVRPNLLHHIVYGEISFRYRHPQGGALFKPEGRTQSLNGVTSSILSARQHKNGDDRLERTLVEASFEVPLEGRHGTPTNVPAHSKR